MTALRPKPTFDQLHAQNVKRLEQINAQGATLSGIDEHYTQALVEELLGPERVARVAYAHQEWLSDQLDRVESAMRQAVLTAPPEPFRQGVAAV